MSWMYEGYGVGVFKKVGRLWMLPSVRYVVLVFMSRLRKMRLPRCGHALSVSSSASNRHPARQAVLAKARRVFHRRELCVRVR